MSFSRQSRRSSLMGGDTYRLLSCIPAPKGRHCAGLHVSALHWGKRGVKESRRTGSTGRRGHEIWWREDKEDPPASPFMSEESGGWEFSGAVKTRKPRQDLSGRRKKGVTIRFATSALQTEQNLEAAVPFRSVQSEKACCHRAVKRTLILHLLERRGARSARRHRSRNVAHRRSWKPAKKSVSRYFVRRSARLPRPISRGEWDDGGGGRS